MHGICGVTLSEVVTCVAHSGVCAPLQTPVPGVTETTFVCCTVQPVVVVVLHEPSAFHAVHSPIWTLVSFDADVPMFEPPVSEIVPPAARVIAVVP
jgi:hypothetical protein